MDYYYIAHLNLTVYFLTKHFTTHYLFYVRLWCLLFFKTTSFKYDFHMITCTHFKCMGFNEFDKCVHPYNQQHNQDRTFPSLWKVPLCPCSYLLPNTSGPWQLLICYFVTIAYSRISCKCNHSVLDINSSCGTYY